MRRALFTILLCLAPAAAPAARVLIEGDRLTLEARDAPLAQVLRFFTHAGVKVSLDPSIELAVSGSYRNEDMEAVLQEILDPVSYVLTWEVLRSPLGDLPRLAEIQIFRAGHKERTKPLEQEDPNLRVTRGNDPSGPLFVEDEILIAVRKGTTMAEFRLLLSQVGGTVVGCIPELGIYRVRLAPGTNVAALVEQLRGKPIVSRVERNYAAQLPLPVGGPDTGGATGRLRPPPVRPGTQAVAILDSGLLSTAGLDDHVVATYDALSPERALTDRDGHGTQMALVASGAVTPSGAPGDGAGVPIVAIRAFDDNGVTSNYAMMRSIAFAIEKGAGVLSLSWGAVADSSFMETAIDYALSKGLVVVAAAGNEPTGKPVYPSAYPGVVAVTATNPDGSLWSQSNYGPNTTVAAPGRASFPIGHKGPPGAYVGTSIATAYVAREIALYLGRNDGASGPDAVAALRKAVTDAGASGRDPYFGYGALDAAALDRYRN
jgi:hypothetical protein